MNGDKFIDMWSMKQEPKSELWISIDKIYELGSDNCSFNITHNLGEMASHCNLYEPLWRPYRLFNISEDDEYDTTILAKDIVEYVEKGYKLLVDNKEDLLQYESSNGYGKYNDLVKFTRRYIDCLKKFPNSRISISR
jgi:hypothetical protein